MNVWIGILIGLAVIGAGLIVWALKNPAWQHAEAYDSVFPMLLGLVFVSFALIAGGVTAIIHAI